MDAQPQTIYLTRAEWAALVHASKTPKRGIFVKAQHKILRKRGLPALADYLWMTQGEGPHVDATA